MPIDPKLFEPAAGERLEAAMTEATRGVVRDDPFALREVVGLVGGYALHLSKGLEGAGFDEDEAQATGWHTAWDKLHDVLQSQTFDTVKVATLIDRDSSLFGSDFSESGEPSHIGLRAFYRVFLRKIDAPSIHADAAWLSDSV